MPTPVRVRTEHQSNTIVIVAGTLSRKRSTSDMMIRGFWVLSDQDAHEVANAGPLLETLARELILEYETKTGHKFEGREMWSRKPLKKIRNVRKCGKPPQRR